MRHLLLIALLATAAVPPPAGRATVRPGDVVKHRYVVGFLYRGAAWTPERNARTDSLQAGHMANLERRYEEGWLVGAGPIMDPASNLRGLFFFRADSVAQVEPLVATDPAIAAGRLRIELVPWLGDAGVGDDYRRARAANPALPDSMVRYVMAVMEPARRSRCADPGLTMTYAHLRGLRRAGRLILFGPLVDDPRGREFAVFATHDTAEVRSWMEEDPAVRSGCRHVELHPWLVGHGVIPGH